MRLSFLLFLVLAPLAHAALRPNILFLFADDMRADSVGALGNPVAHTPTIDALVRRGFAMRNAFCLGGNSGAVCTPSRNMLLSGKAYFRWKDYVVPGGKNKGLLAPAEAPNLPLSFKDGGYATYHHGKRGNTATLIQAKFEVNRYLDNDEADRQSGEPGRAIADAAIGWLKERKDDRPFLMYLAFGNPHDPRIAAEKYHALYDRAKIPLPRNFLPIHPFNNGDMTVRDEKLLPWPRTEDGVRGQLYDYYAAISALDYHMGRILEALKESGQLDHTIVVFSADQGVAIGSHGLLGKQNLYEDTMKCPLVFAGPGIPHGESDAMVYLLDIFPTLCDYAGLPAPAGIDGKSFRPVIEGKSGKARAEIFLSYLGVQRSLRDERWKLIRYPRVNVTQLFDLQADPDERNDLSGEPAQTERVAAMMSRLQAAQGQWGDTLPLTVPNPQPSAWTPPAPRVDAAPKAK